jgi:aspartyl/glutamyl-tRNA(Asn/Gln) amidotransferase C subunit
MAPHTRKEAALTKGSTQQTDEITPENFDHLVQLAAFHLEQEQKDYLRKELNAQLKAIRELEALEVAAEVPITSHGVPYTETNSAPLRADNVEACPEADDIVEGAPQTELRYIVVPEIPHEELE